MSLVSRVSDSLSSYARSWGFDPSVFRTPSRRELGLAAVLSAAPLLTACPDPGGNGGVNPPPPVPSDGPVVVGLPSSFVLDSGVLEVPYSVDRDFDRCRLRLHGVTVAVDEDVRVGDHVISFPRLRPGESYPVDVLCSDETGLTHDRGQIVQGDYRFSMDDFRSDTVEVSVGSLESCSFDPVQAYASLKGNLPVSSFAPLDEGCYWNPTVDADRDSLEFVTPEEIRMIDWLSSDARSEGMSDHTIDTLLDRTAGSETLLSRALVWWELDPRIWEDEIDFAQRGWRLYRENVSRDWQDGSFDLDYRILGLKNEHWPEDYQMPGVRASGVEDLIGIPINPGMIGMSFLNLSDDYLNEAETWLSKLGYGPECNLFAERKGIFSHDTSINADFALDDARYPNGIPYSWLLPTEGRIVSLAKEFLDFVGNNDFDVHILVEDHSRDLYKGAPAGFIFQNTHLVPSDLNGDGMFGYSDTSLSEGMFVPGYSQDEDGGLLMFTNPGHISQIDYNAFGPSLGRLESRKWAWGGDFEISDPDHPFYSFGMPRSEFGMIDAEMIETGSGFVGLGWVDSKFARISGMSGTNPLVDLSIYAAPALSPSGSSCEPYELFEIELD